MCMHLDCFHLISLLNPYFSSHKKINSNTSNGFHHHIENTINKLASNMKIAFHKFTPFFNQLSHSLSLCICVPSTPKHWIYSRVYFELIPKTCWPLDWHRILDGERERELTYFASHILIPNAIPITTTQKSTFSHISSAILLKSIHTCTYTQTHFISFISIDFFLVF